MKRCVWCGKKISYPKDHRRVEQKEIPRYFKFARCSHCDNYYGQDIHSKEVIICFISSAALIILAVVLRKSYILIGAIFVAYCALLTPIKKMTQYEIPIYSENKKYTFIICEYYKKIKCNKMYFLDEQFDELHSFKTVSPLYIHSKNKKTNEIIASFIYEHPLNQKYLDGGSMNICDEHMVLSAKIIYRQN